VSELPVSELPVSELPVSELPVSEPRVNGASPCGSVVNVGAAGWVEVRAP